MTDEKALVDWLQICDDANTYILNPCNKIGRYVLPSELVDKKSNG